MNETRIFLELIKVNGKTMFSVGGGLYKDGQMESFDLLEDAIDEVEHRAYYSQYRLENNN